MAASVCKTVVETRDGVSNSTNSKILFGLGLQSGIIYLVTLKAACFPEDYFLPALVQLLRAAIKLLSSCGSVGRFRSRQKTKSTVTTEIE
jgi:hypothetical protein